MARIALKVDVDTLRGTREGVPRLLDLMARHRARGTFLFSLGPDHTGWALRRGPESERLALFPAPPGAAASLAGAATGRAGGIRVAHRWIPAGPARPQGRASRSVGPSIELTID